MYSDETTAISQPRRSINGDIATYTTNASDIAVWAPTFYDKRRGANRTATFKGVRNNTASDCTIVIHMADDYSAANSKEYSTWVIPAGQTVGVIFDQVIKTGTSSPSGCLFFPM